MNNKLLAWFFYFPTVSFAVFILIAFFTETIYLGDYFTTRKLQLISQISFAITATSALTYLVSLIIDLLAATDGQGSYRLFMLKFIKFIILFILLICTWLFCYTLDGF